MAVTKELRLFNPEKSGETKHCGSLKEMDDIALSCLFEIRGKQRIKQLQDGMELVNSPFKIKPAKDINAVPIICNDTGEVRHVDFTPANPGAARVMASLFQGRWRLATATEQETGLAKDEADRKLEAETVQKVLEAPAERIGAKIASVIANLPQVQVQVAKTKRE